MMDYLLADSSFGLFASLISVKPFKGYLERELVDSIKKVKPECYAPFFETVKISIDLSYLT